MLISCEGDILLTYEWIGMEASNADTNEEYPEVNGSDSIPADNYTIKLKMNSKEISKSGRYYDTETPPRNMNALDSLMITSNSDFDEEHLLGTNLSDLFYFLIGNYFHTLPADGSEGTGITNVYSKGFEDDPMVENIDLVLDKAPTLGQIHQFKVTWILKDGTTFTDETSEITLY